MVEKNKIKPTEVSIGSYKKVIWICEKGHFILLMIAHIIMQLMEMHERNIGIFETIHKISQRIKEALRTQPLSASDVLDISTSFHLSRISL